MRWLSLVLLLLSRSAQAQRHRAIVVSFDGLSEAPARMFMDSLNTPTLWSMFHRDVCADGARPAFVSVTPSGHAAIWTGAYGNVNGIEAIGNGALPLDRTTILETTDGYRAPTSDFIDGIAYDGRKPNAYIESLKIGLKGKQVVEGSAVVGG